MDFLPSFIRRFLSKAKSVTGQWTVISGGADSVERNLLAANKEWVYIASDKVASSVAGIRFKVMRYQASGDDREVFEGPMVDFLEKPCVALSGKDFIYLNTIYKELTGNAYWEKVGGGKLQPLVPTQLSPIVKDEQIVGYKYTESTGQRMIALKDVLHDRYVDPAKPWMGVGRLSKIAKWADTSSYASEFLRLFFAQGAQFGGFIKTEEESEERIKLIKLGLHQEHVGVQNAHKIAVLPKGSEYQAATATMSDMQYRELEDQYRDKILAAFGVPKTIVGLTTEVNRASAEASEYIFAAHTLKPIVDDFIEFLNNNIAPTYDKAGKLYFAYDEFVPVNMEIELKEREIALNRQPYKTVNEVRAELGLPKVKGGDIIYGNPFQVPLGQPAPEPAMPDEEGDEEPEDDEPEEDEPKKAAPAHVRRAVVVERAKGAIFDAVKTVIEKRQAFETAHNDPDAIAHKSFVARVSAHERLVADKVRLFNNKQHRDVVQKLNQITKGVSKGDLFDMDGEVAVLIDFVSPMLKGLMVEQAIAEYIAQEFPGELDANKKTITRAVELAAKRLAKSYNNTTADLLKSALNDGIQNGEDLVQLTERVKTVYDFSDAYRAPAVARTESFYIANEGSREAYRQSGVVTEIRWYTAEDEGVCEFCGPENGRVIGISEVFYPKGETVTGSEGGKLPTDYRAIDVPPLHPNCRCFIRPETVEVS